MLKTIYYDIFKVSYGFGDVTIGKLTFSRCVIQAMRTRRSCFIMSIAVRRRTISIDHWLITTSMSRRDQIWNSAIAKIDQTTRKTSTWHLIRSFSIRPRTFFMTIGYWREESSRLRLEASSVNGRTNVSIDFVMWTTWCWNCDHCNFKIIPLTKIYSNLFFWDSDESHSVELTVHLLHRYFPLNECVSTQLVSPETLMMWSENVCHKSSWPI